MPNVNKEDMDAFTQWLVDTGRINETIEETPNQLILKSQDSVCERFYNDWLDFIKVQPEKMHPLDIQNNDQFFQWILDQIEDDPQEIANFISTVVPTEAMEHFNNLWIEYVERMRDNDA